MLTDFLVCLILLTFEESLVESGSVANQNGASIKQSKPL